MTATTINFRAMKVLNKSQNLWVAPADDGRWYVVVPHTGATPPRSWRCSFPSEEAARQWLETPISEHQNLDAAEAADEVRFESLGGRWPDDGEK
jgi:hypothetical protein